MDLQALQTQLRLVIQNHQIVVSKMRNDPQNIALQKQLHDLQAEIRSLSDKQKQVVEQLRKDLEKKKQQVVLTANSNLPSGFSPVSNTLACSQPQEVRLVCAAPKTNLNHRITTPVQTVALTTKSIPLSSLRQPVPPVNNIASSAASLAFKAPVGTVVLPNCTTTNALLTPKNAENQKLHPVLVVPSPSRCGDVPQTGVLVNIMPPIRVPQYPPPAPRPAGQVVRYIFKKPLFVASSAPRNIEYAQEKEVRYIFKKPLFVASSAPRNIEYAQEKESPTKTNCTNSSVPVSVNSTITSALTLKFTPVVPEKSPVPASVPSRSPNNSSKLQASVSSSEKFPNKIDQKKKEFMLALGLVTKDSLIEYKNKRMERKRRTTANPQFSNAALEEKWRNAAAAAAAQAASQPSKRPRGRPRLDSKINSTSSNGTQGVSEASPQENSSTPSTPGLPTIDTPSSAVTTVTVVNGMHRRLSPSLEAKNVEELLSGLCIVCTQPGDLVKCDSCAKQQHPGCMQPPLLMPPQGKWQCSDCQSRAESLPTVHSYVAVRAAKEDEKRKLLKRSLELRLKRSQLEGRLYQLKDLASKQKDRQSELQETIREMGTNLETFETVLTGVRQCS